MTQDDLKHRLGVCGLAICVGVLTLNPPLIIGGLFFTGVLKIQEKIGRYS
jgi:hypothetical protein